MRFGLYFGCILYKRFAVNYCVVDVYQSARLGWAVTHTEMLALTKETSNIMPCVGRRRDSMTTALSCFRWQITHDS